MIINNQFVSSYNKTITKRVFFSESVWVAPKEGFLSLDEYNKINKQAIIKQEEHLRIESNKFKDNADEIAAKYQREKLKKYKVKDSVKEEKVSDVEPVYSFQSPDEAAQPFGQWQTVVKKYESSPN